MALLQYGAVAQKLSGRVAGNVFAHNKGGAYLRRYSVPVNPATTFQQNVRGDLADNSQRWRNLTDAQRAAWVSWASTHPIVNRLGATILLSGQQAYVSLNRNGFSAGAGAGTFDNPPPDPTFEFPFAADFAVDADATGGNLTIERTVAVTVDTIVQVFATPPLSAGRSFAKDKVKFIGLLTIASADAPPDDQDILAAWVERFGTFGVDLIGKKIIIAVRSYSQGQWSGLSSSSGICA